MRRTRSVRLVMMAQRRESDRVRGLLMKIDDVEMIGGPLVLATQAEVDALEAKLWIRFPEGYREYITRLGEGVLGGTMVRIYPPWRIEKELSRWRARIKKYWFWDEGKELLPRERALECVVLGDTVNGDELIFHPGRPDRLFVLPHESENVFDPGRDVLEAVEWICAVRSTRRAVRGTPVRTVRQ